MSASDKIDSMEIETTNNCTGTAAAAAAAVQPEDPKFLESLPSELLAIGNNALEGSENAAIRLEKMEVQLRQMILRRIRESSADLGECWTLSLRLCLHFVFMSDETEEAQYKNLNARKIPFVLLEDIFDCLSFDQSRTFWHNFVLGSYETIFGQRIWSPSPTQHPCWLPFLKITNKLIRRMPPKDAASIMLTLCRVYPLAERSGTRAWGSHNADNVTSYEQSDEFEEEQSRIPVEIKMDEEGSVSDYSFYESFWKLQEDLNHPNVVEVAGFLHRLKSLITALETHSVSSQAVSCSRGIKYLTGSHLMPYQLADPEFRIHILTQILIVCHHLSSAGPLFRTKLVDWQNRSRVLLKNIGQEGAKHLELLDSILGRLEEAWRAWKKEKCQEDLDKRHSKPLTNRKRRRSLGGTLGAAAEEDEATLALTQGILNSAQLAAASKQMRGQLPSMDTHLAEYIEALDPEAGIEAEYHPKNNKLFAWRALRVMSRDHLSFMQLVHVNGDFEGLVRHIYKEERSMDIPGDHPQYEVEDFEEKEDEEIVEKQEQVDEGKPAAESVEDEKMEEETPRAPTESEKDSEAVKSTEGPAEAPTDEKHDEETSVQENGGTVMDVDKEEGEEKEKDEAEPNASPSDSDDKPAPESSNEASDKPAPEPQNEPPGKEPPVTSGGERPKLDFIPPPQKDTAQPKDTDTGQRPPSENGQKRKAEDAVDVGSGGGRRQRGGPGRGEPRGRGPNERGRNAPQRGDRGPPLGRDDRRGREDRRSPAVTGRDDRGHPPGRGDRGPPPGKGDRGPPPGKGDRGSPPRRDDRGPPPPPPPPPPLSSRRDDHWVPPPGRGGHGRDDHRRGGGGGGGRGGGGGHRGEDRGPPPERWDDQRRRRDERGEDRRDGDERRGPRRRNRN